MDLNSTLIRAEALFKRYQRLVDAVDKKGSFPAPRARLTQGSAGAAESGSSAEPAAAAPTSPDQGRNAGKAPAQQQGQPSPQQQQVEKVITPELRRLLSRQVEVLPRKEVAKKGDGGFGARGG